MFRVSGLKGVRPRARAGIGLLAIAVLVTGTGCGSRASDAEIVAALRAGAPVAGTQVAAPAAESPQPGSDAAAAVVPAAPSTDSAAASGAAPQASVSSGTPMTVGKHSASTGTPAAPRTHAAARTLPKTTEGGVAAPAVANKSEIRVGTVGSWSGIWGALLSTMPKTETAWVAYTNAHGGINGHPVRLIVGDDEGDPATGLTLVKRMVESDKIIAMVGGLIMFGFPEIEHYMRAKNIPMIGGDGVNPGWYTSPVAFPATGHSALQIVAGLRTLVNDGQNKLAVLYCLEVSSLCTYMHDVAMKSDVGKYVVQSYQVSLVAPSYASQCLRMKDAGVQAMFLLMDTAGAARMAKDCATQGFKPKIMLMGLDASPEMPTLAALKDAYVPGATFSPAPGQGIPAIDKYRAVMAQYGPTVGEAGAGSLGWTAAELFALVGRNLSDNPTSAELFEALWKVKNETLGGLTVPLTFAKGKNAVAPACVFIWGVSNNKFTAPRGSKPLC